MNRNKQDININCVFENGIEYKCRKSISDKVSNYYSEIIIDKITNRVPENQITEALITAKEILKNKL